MIIPTPQVMDQFQRLVHSQLHTFFTVALDKCRDDLEAKQNIDDLRTIQGEVKVLRTILKAIESGKQA